MPKLVLGILYAQHHPIKIVEVLNYYDIPCTVAAEKRGLLQVMDPDSWGHTAEMTLELAGQVDRDCFDEEKYKDNE